MTFISTNLLLLFFFVLSSFAYCKLLLSLYNHVSDFTKNNLLFLFILIIAFTTVIVAEPFLLFVQSYLLPLDQNEHITILVIYTGISLGAASATSIEVQLDSNQTPLVDKKYLTEGDGRISCFAYFYRVVQVFVILYLGSYGTGQILLILFAPENSFLLAVLSSTRPSTSQTGLHLITALLDEISGCPGLFDNACNSRACESALTGEVNSHGCEELPDDPQLNNPHDTDAQN